MAKADFEQRFLEGRLQGFEKDMRICLRGTPRADGRRGNTHAYFPALSVCCSTLEYLAALHSGRLKDVGKAQVSAYALRFMPQPDYEAEAIRILFDALRNTVNHRGIGNAVWIDPHAASKGRRLTWNIKASARRPAISVETASGVIKKSSPWPCCYSHRVHIELGRLWRDIARSVTPYLFALQNEPVLSARFMTCMKELYPK